MNWRWWAKSDVIYWEWVILGMKFSVSCVCMGKVLGRDVYIHKRGGSIRVGSMLVR